MANALPRHGQAYVGTKLRSIISGVMLSVTQALIIGPPVYSAHAFIHVGGQAVAGCSHKFEFVVNRGLFWEEWGLLLGFFVCLVSIYGCGWRRQSPIRVVSGHRGEVTM